MGFGEYYSSCRRCKKATAETDSLPQFEHLMRLIDTPRASKTFQLVDEFADVGGVERRAVVDALAISPLSLRYATMPLGLADFGAIALIADATTRVATKPRDADCRAFSPEITIISGKLPTFNFDF